MPCWEKRKISLSFVTANRELLLQTLEALGFKYFASGDWMKTRATITREQALTSEALFAYNEPPHIYSKMGATAVFQDGTLEVRSNNEAIATRHASKIQQGYAAAAVRYATSTSA